MEVEEGNSGSHDSPNVRLVNGFGGNVRILAEYAFLGDTVKNFDEICFDCACVGYDIGNPRFAIMPVVLKTENVQVAGFLVTEKRLINVDRDRAFERSAFRGRR